MYLFYFFWTFPCQLDSVAYHIFFVETRSHTWFNLESLFKAECSGTVFELRKNKWLSHGQPGYNIWLSVQVFGCPYMVALEFHSLGVKIYGCPSDNCISFFACPANCLVVPGARTTKISNAAQELPGTY